MTMIIWEYCTLSTQHPAHTDTHSITILAITNLEQWKKLISNPGKAGRTEQQQKKLLISINNFL